MAVGDETVLDADGSADDGAIAGDVQATASTSVAHAPPLMPRRPAADPPGSCGLVRRQDHPFGRFPRGRGSRYVP
jgi:hypothetical protein